MVEFPSIPLCGTEVGAPACALSVTAGGTSPPPTPSWHGEAFIAALIILAVMIFGAWVRINRRDRAHPDEGVSEEFERLKNERALRRNRQPDEECQMAIKLTSLQSILPGIGH